MATHQISILNGALSLGSSGNVYATPFDTLATNDVWKHIVLAFKDTATRDLIYGQFTVPQNYVGTPKIIPVWSTSATSGNAIWDFDYRAEIAALTAERDELQTQLAELRSQLAAIKAKLG